MKKAPFLIIFLFAIGVLHSQTSYYWYKANKINLEVDSSILYLQYNPVDHHLGKSEVAAGLKISNSTIYQLSDNEFIIQSKQKIDKNNFLESSIPIKYMSPLLKNRSATMIILPRIVVQLKEGHSIDELLSLQKNRLRLKKDKGFNTYVLEYNGSSSKEILDISNSLYERSGIVSWSEPEFYSNYRPATDPLYPDQYYLHNTGQLGGIAGIDINVEPAWSVTTGSNTLRVAVIDAGVEDHEDFTGRVLSGYTAGSTTGTGAPQNGEKPHGVACAGIIAASHNNIGIRGVAPNVLIVPVNIFPNTPVIPEIDAGAATNAEIADAIDWAWNQGAADILSNSWGGGSPSNNISDAIGRARTQGRVSGSTHLGCPVIFCSGNDYPGQAVWFPGNVDGVITVGACNNAAPAGDIWYYSDRGPSMDLVAPSGDVGSNGDVRTTDRMGSAGYEPGNYTSGFGGTSAACPQVAGIAALMLSVAPNLTEAQVRTILQTTATDMGTPGFDNTYGFGRANACGAISQALSTGLSISGDNLVCGTSNNYSIPGLPAGLSVTWQADPAGAVVINSPNATQTTITKIYDATIILKAIISGGCGGTLTRQVTVGVPAYNIQSNVPCQPGTIVQLSTFTAFPIAIPSTTYHWRSVHNGISTTIPGSGPSVSKKFPLGSYEIYSWAQNACGSAPDEVFTEFTVLSCSGRSQPGKMLLSPNPASGTVTVSVDESKEDKSANATNTSFDEIRIYDLQGNLKKEQRFNKVRTATINISNIPDGIYFMEITSGDFKERQQLLIKK